ncbi:hypothetical protein C0431_14700 [bacterium]|nr:hypothetical protein [bacterium]
MESYVDTVNTVMEIKHSNYKATGWLLIAQALLIAIPLTVLGSAIGWPASLSDPASIALPRMISQAVSIKIGYIAYLAYSVLFFITATLTIQAIRPKNNEIAIGAAALSTLARSIGIIRWLTVMPLLAQMDAQANSSSKEMIAIVFASINSLAGSIGEYLGVSLFAAIWAVAVAHAMSKSKQFGRIWAVLTYLTAGVLFVPAVELIGFDLGPVLTICGVLSHLWMIALGIKFIRIQKELNINKSDFP